jgi:oxygen-independent coproporphyrinogen-3 oxidase
MDKLLLKYNKPGPRYTSYPPATFFSDTYTEELYREDLTRSNEEDPHNISFYIHIPFCTRLCHFCGCNTTLYKDEDTVGRYIEAVIKEIDTVSGYLDKNRKVSQVHWGGGTPNSIDMKYIDRIMNKLHSKFSFIETPEIAMECNPAYLEYTHIDILKSLTFNRLSIGVQDFNQTVLDHVNRASSKHPLNSLIDYIRQQGFSGINLDFIYGLPGQTLSSFEDTIRKAVELSPDRIVTFSYAHVPWFKSPQKNLEAIGLPGPEEKITMFLSGFKILTESGYTSIGMDHYAKDTDSLSEALRNKTLHRNFQGYCTKETTGQVYAFGSSGISQLTGAFIQNVKPIDQYIELISKKGLAVERGYRPSMTDRMIGDIINRVMCNGYLDLDEVAQAYSIGIDDLIRKLDFNPERFKEFTDDGLLEINGNKLQIKNNGFMVVRNIAMEFDILLDRNTMNYSKTI